MNISNVSSGWIRGFLGLALSATAASAQVVLSPVAVVGTDLGAASEIAPLVNMINQSGIEQPFLSGSTVFDTYFANPGQVFAMNGDQGKNNWQSEVSFNLPLKGYVDFDLGATYRINKIAIWNLSIKDLTVKVLEDLHGPEQIAGSFTLFSRLSFPFSYAVDVLPFSTPRVGRYVRLAIDSVNTFPGLDSFGYAIIGEVAVSAAPVGPSAPLPPLSVTLNSNGDVALAFTGTLQSSLAMDGTFTDVPGKPQGAHTLPKRTLSTQQFFRTTGN